MKAKLFSLAKADWLKALIMLVMSTFTGLVLDAVVQQVQSGTYCFSCIHWAQIGFSILVAVLAYIQKNLGTNSQDQFLTKEPSKKTNNEQAN